MKCLRRISLQEFCRGMPIPSRRMQNVGIFRRYLLDGDPLLGVPARATAVVPSVDASDLVFSYLVFETTFMPRARTHAHAPGEGEQ